MAALLSFVVVVWIELMRFEFIEIFIRISIAKYIESGEMTDVIVAVRKLMAEHFAPNKGEGELNKI